MTQPIWNTPAGALGSFPNGIAMSLQLSASVQTPAHTITYKLLNGILPSPIVLTVDGLLHGTPASVVSDTTYTFTVRVTDNLLNIRDRTFNMVVSGSAIPLFNIPDSNLLSVEDSIWVYLPVTYTNTDPTNIVTVEIAQGRLPPGLEINTAGVIQGYPAAPIVNVRLNSISTICTETIAGTNEVICNSTSGFVLGRPVIFTGTMFGNIESGITYYVSEILSISSFKIATTPGGVPITLNTGSGIMNLDLPSTSLGEATINTYSFTLRLKSLLGGDTKSYSITIINQNTTVSQGGPGKSPNTRTPVMLNTQPLTQILTDSDPYYGYYILPTIPPDEPALIGTILSGEYFAFKVNGHDFDGSEIQYSYSGLPLGLIGDTNTGWITGVPVIASGINQFSFSASVYKAASPAISSVYYNFSFKLSNGVNGDVTWVTPADLGSMFNGEVSTLSVSAAADVVMNYRIVGGALPPNLILLLNGEISGSIADQPTSSFLVLGDSTEFSFTIQAYSTQYSLIHSERTFTLTVKQEYNRPTDVLYIKATPSLSDRLIIDSLLTDDTIIPAASLYRAGDIYFGKASSIIYEHMYGILASDLTEYIAAVTKNHYWRNITLGEIKTAVAKNPAGEVIYEVVYSEVIDNLANQELPESTNVLDVVSTAIYWDTPIDLLQGPWYTSITDIYTSYAFDVNGSPTYYTSLTPGYARLLYPNSLYDMRTQLTGALGQEFASKLLPLWMTSQQLNGSTLGYTQAWVIAYVTPGNSTAVKNNIQTLWPYKLNQINFRIDRFSVDKSTTYNYDKNVTPAAWTSLPGATPPPNPLDSADFYVLFPRQTILPDVTQY